MGEDSEPLDGDGDSVRDEKKRLRRVFDEIAEEFSESRDEPWREVVDWVEDVDGGLVLDLGCGNGRHMPALQRRFDRVVGVDFSRELLRRAGREGVVVQGDVARLPFRDSVADAVLYVAALHHLPSHEERLESLDEVGRVLRRGGRALVSVWAIEHGCFDGVRSEIRARDGDYYVGWGDYDRYYHVFDRRGFESLLGESGLRVEDVRLVGGNYYAELGTRG